MKELPSESPAVTSFRRTFELGRSFDLDDDLDFVPGLITESDVSLPAPPVPSVHFGHPAPEMQSLTWSPPPSLVGL